MMFTFGVSPAFQLPLEFAKSHDTTRYFELFDVAEKGRESLFPHRLPLPPKK